MALSENERANIVEEETLRSETRKKIGTCSQAQGHGCHRCRFWVWMIVALVAMFIFHGMGRFHGWCGYDKAYGHDGAMTGRWVWEPATPGSSDGVIPEKAPAKK